MRKSNPRTGAYLMALLLVLGLLVISPATSASGRAAGVHVEMAEALTIGNDKVPVAANNTATVTLEVYNIGDATDSFNVSATIMQSPDGLWTDDLLDVNGTGTPNATLENLTTTTLQGDGVTFDLDLMAPSFAEPLDEAIVEVTVGSQTDPHVQAVQSIHKVVCIG